MLRVEKGGSGVIIGSGQLIGSCTKSSNEMISCTIKGKPLVLSWGQTSRLDSGVRWAEVGPLSGKDPLVIVTCGYGIAWRTFAVPRKLGPMHGLCSLGPKACYTSSNPPSLVWLVRVTLLRAVDVKCVLTQKALDAFCNKFHILAEVHPVLPNQNDTMHERPAGKIGLYTRVFDFANFIFPLSTFLADVLRHFRINISQLSVIGAAKVDDFAFPALFPWHTAKHVTRDPAPLAADFNAHDYATLVAHPSPNGYLCFHSYPRSYQIVESARTAVENVAPVQSRRQGKRKFVIMDAGGVSHPPKKPRKDHGTSSGTSVGGKSWSTLSRFFARAVLNAEVGVAAIPTLPFVTTFVSTTPEREDGDHTDFVAELNLRTIEVPLRSFVPIMTTVTTIISTVDPTSVTKEKLVEPSMFGAGSSLSSGTEPTTGVMTNGSLLNDGRVCREMVDEFAPPKFFTSVRGMEHDQLFTEFNVGAARQMSLSDEGELLTVREEEIKNLKARLLLREAKATEAIRLHAEASNFEAVEKLNALITSVKSRIDSLVDQVHELEISSSELQEKVAVYQNCKEQLEKFQDDQMKVVNDKFEKLYTDFVEIALHLEGKFYPHLLTTISGRRWLLTQGMKLAIIKCLNSPGYLFALEAAISKTIEMGMQDGLSAGINHGKEGVVLTDVASHNPSAEVDYISALQQLQNVNFPLLVKLKSNKDARIKTVRDILRLEGLLVDKLRWDELQPNVDQLMVPIHHSPNKVVIGATALSLALDVSSIRVWKIKENISNHKSALRDVFIPLADPFYDAALIGTKGTSDAVAATADATMALSTTFASANTIAPISVDDYDVIGVDDQAVADGDDASFPNVDDAELNIPQ
nr:transposase (putative), gypsy type [Tanacetum cinerariifolium]